ncbi:MAG: Lipoprotein [Frankiales bacterium]|nr:Lipoprotein [Frankiales bacterium]
MTATGAGSRRAAARVACIAVLGLTAPFLGTAVPASGSPATVGAAELDGLAARVDALTATAEKARTAVLDAASTAVSLRLELDQLADERDAAQEQVDAALVELYEQSVTDTGTAAIGPQLQDLNPALAQIYGNGVTRQQSTVDTLDAHTERLAELADRAQRYRDLLLGKAKKVYAAEDEALTLLATERDAYERQRRAADVARIDAQVKHLRDISDQVSTAVSPGIGTRGIVALGKQAAVIDLLNEAGSGYPAGYGPTGQTFDGTSSWYGPGFEGKPTATGAPFDPEKLTAAMKAVPLGTVIHVTRGNRGINLLVNDRGPYVGDRIIDCSRAGSRALGFDGLAEVHIEVLGPLG